MNDKEKHVKLYDLQNNLITEFYTFKEAAKYLGVTHAAAKNSCYRGHISQKKYKIKSEGQKFAGFRHGITSGPEYCKLMKSRNKKRCMIKYKDPVLEALSIKRNDEINSSTCNKRRSRALVDIYIIKAIEKHVGLKSYQITQQMIDVKRKHIEIIRKLKQIEK
jgi:hypothetical protein